MLVGITLLTLGLTFGASYGWKTAAFLAPFLLAFVAFPAFFLWEAYLPEELALLPPKVWKIGNVLVWIVFATTIYAWWGVNFLAFVENYLVQGESAIIAAVRLLPEGVTALVVTLVMARFPVIVSKPRITIPVGMVLSIVGYVLFIQSGGSTGARYWMVFAGGIVGSGGMMAVFNTTNIALMSSVPPEIAGVAGALLQVALQVGVAVGLGVQSGLLTVTPGGVENFQNISTSFYFQLGWTALWLIGFMVFFRPAKNAQQDSENVVAVL